MQGWEFAYRFFKIIICFLWAKERKCDLLIFWVNHTFTLFKEQREWIAHSHSFVMSDLRNLLSFFCCKEGREKITKFALYKRANEQRVTWAIHSWTYKMGKTVEFFERITFLCERFTWIKSESLTSLFFIEQIAHGRSFVKSDMSETLTVAL